ncbi:winged helix-turn-helix transcriptional regulator, partial [Geobacillus sp. MMMUD3]|nr:winged helix-turn-helix transcriptional regulator [Geobacillus sp. MMMUD3]
MSGTRTGESMLSRHLRILDVFGVDSAFLTLSQISRRSGLPVSTTHRLLDELERERLVERLPDRSYRLGLRLWELAARTPGALGLR